MPESAAQRTRRMTPVHERAQNLGVVLKPTPEGLREAAASNFQFADGADAKTVLHKHTKRSFGKPSLATKSVWFV